MTATPFVFHRTELAKSIADGIEGTGLADFRSGLFLAAPRRTGKSTFLTGDLLPECERREWLPVYVDLWADRQADPADLISSAIASELAKFESRIRKLLKKAGAEKLSIFRTLNFDLARPTLPTGSTLSDALHLLHRSSDKTVVLIIDEAQHALSTAAGLNTMFALKSARDTLNTRTTPNVLRLVFTGSSRDKLAQLVLSKNQPFYGSRVTTFPLLDRNFTDAFTSHYNASLREDRQFRAEDVLLAFEMVGHRPELLRSLVGEVGLDLGAAADLGDLLKHGAWSHRDGIWSEYESSWQNLTPLQRGVLETMARKLAAKEPFAPFTDATLSLVREAMVDEDIEDEPQPTTAGVQKALDALREKDLVWKPERGGYAFEDSSMAEWIVMRTKR